MKPSLKIKLNNRYEVLLIISVILILIKSFEYLLIGIIYPLLISIIILSPFIYHCFKKHSNLQKIIKYWSFFIIAYGIIRLLLNGLIYIDSRGIPSGIYYQFTFWYAVKTISYVALGIVLLLKRKQIFLNLSQ